MNGNSANQVRGRATQKPGEEEGSGEAAADESAAAETESTSVVF